MASINIQVKGVDRLNRKLTLIQGEVPEELRKAMNKAAAVVSASAKALVPVDTGALRNSIHIKKAEAHGDSVTSGVHTSKEYAPYVEFGTGARGGSPAATKLGVTFNRHIKGQVAQPYLYPALKQNSGKINEIVAQAVIAATRKGK
jgi:HK97 gp10 family phage protein